MGIFREFPYSNFHDMNLDWLLRMMRDLELEWKDFEVNWSEEVQEKVYQWLNEHPEATTTVQDHSISEIKLTDELAEKTIKDYYTPQMFGAVGDGVADDTEAFRALEHLDPVIIPVGDYRITEEIKLDHVEGDLGRYNHFMPLYEKDLNIPLSTVGFGDDIENPITTSYSEAVTYMNNQYYVVCRNYTNDVAYIAIYDDDLNFSYSLTLRAVYGNANSIHNDGDFIYIDFDTGYHVRFNPDLTGEIDIFNSDYKYIIPYNNYFYGIKLGTSGVDDLIIAKMDGFGGSVVSITRIPVEYDTPQSGSIINGVLVLTCVFQSLLTRRYVRLVDIATSKTNRIPFNSISEIENFFEKDGVIKAHGHVYGFNGTFNIGELNGIDYPTIQYIVADGSVGAKNLLVGYRYNAYRIINGTAMNFPENVGDFFTLTDMRFFVSNTDHLYYYKNGWHKVANLTSSTQIIPITIAGNSFNGSVREAGACASIYIVGGGTTMTSFSSGSVIGRVPANLKPTSNTLITGTARTAGGWAGATIYPITIAISTETGDIGINGNNVDLQSCAYIAVQGMYPIAT